MHGINSRLRRLQGQKKYMLVPMYDCICDGEHKYLSALDMAFADQEYKTVVKGPVHHYDRWPVADKPDFTALDAAFAAMADGEEE